MAQASRVHFKQVEEHPPEAGASSAMGDDVSPEAINLLGAS